MRRDENQRLRILLLDFTRRVEALADKTPDVPALLARLERELERALEAQITRIL